MPSRKTLSILIICLSLVVSVFILRKKPLQSAVDTHVPLVSVKDYVGSEKTNDAEWKKLLGNVNTSSEKVMDLTPSSTSDFDASTLTSQVSIDFMSQYLALKSTGKSLTETDINTIIQTTLSNPEYKNTQGVKYIPSNIQTIPNTVENIQKYRNNAYLSLKKRSAQVTDDPFKIMTEVARTNNEKVLARLDPLIGAAQETVNDFLKMEVPSDAVSIHLALLNTFSNIETNLVAMRNIYNDPLKALVGVNQYKTNLVDFHTSISNLNSYLSRKLGHN